MTNPVFHLPGLAAEQGSKADAVLATRVAEQVGRVELTLFMSAYTIDSALERLTLGLH